MINLLCRAKKRIYHLDIDGVDDNPFNINVVNRINILRKGTPLKLISHKLITFLANEHSTFDHNNDDIRRQLIIDNTRFNYVAENVGHGYEVPGNIVNAWYNSPGHREKMLGNYTHIVIGESERIITAIFLRK